MATSTFPALLILPLLGLAHICRVVSPVAARANSSMSDNRVEYWQPRLVGDAIATTAASDQSAEEEEEEFLMDSETNRRMLASSYPAVNAVQFPKRPATACGRRGQRYCVPNANKVGKPIEKCGRFKRKC